MTRRGASAAILLPAGAIAALVLLVTAASAQETTGARAARSAAATQSLLVYSLPSKEAYVDNADDRARGEGHNPFGNYAGSTTTPPTNERVYGPFSGDEGIYGAKLFSDAGHKNPVGTAIAICQYTQNQQSFCDVSLGLAGGQLLAKGASSFSATEFTLPIVGGTGAYRNMTGHVDVTALGWRTQPQPVPRVAPMVQAQRLAIAIRPTYVGAARTLSQYSAPTHETFVDNDDDEARGDLNNPFGYHHAQAAANKESGEGPFPGDEALFSFDTSAQGALKPQSGTAIYTCQYSFFKNAFCDATFQLKDGTLIGAGESNFDSRTFAMAITGGTGAYNGLSGDVQLTPHGQHAQHLVFQLH
jgi:hypothetical protein